MIKKKKKSPDQNTKKKKNSPFDHETKGVNVTLIGIVSSILCSLIVAGGFYLMLVISQQARKMDKMSYEQLIVRDIAASINTALSAKLDSLEGISKDPDLVKILLDGNKNEIDRHKKKIENFFPGALRVDILPTDINEPITDVEPPIGFTVIEMVKEANKTKSAPIVQIIHPGGKDEYIAYLQPVVDDNVNAIGHILVRFKDSAIKKILRKQKLDEGYAEVVYRPKGKAHVLAEAGEKRFKQGNPGKTEKIAFAPINVSYYIGGKPGLLESIETLDIAVIAIASFLLLTLSCFVPVRVFSRLLKKDGVVLINFVEDIKENRVKLKYGLHLTPLKSAMNSMLEIAHDISADRRNAPIRPSKVHDVGQQPKTLVVDEVSDDELEDAAAELERETTEIDVIYQPKATEESIIVEEQDSLPDALQINESDSAEAAADEEENNDDDDHLLEFSTSKESFAIKKTADQGKKPEQQDAPLEGEDCEIPSLFDELFTEDEGAKEGSSMVERDSSNLIEDDKGGSLMLGEIEPEKPKYDDDAEIPESIFRAYDIRGVVGETLTPSVVRLIGKAIGSQAADSGQAAIVVGRDGRLSGPELMEALIDGLKSTGRMVINIGEVPTPVMYYATYSLGTGAGVALTGSHNPSNYNGLKIMLGGKTLSGSDIQNLRIRAEKKDFIEAQGHGREQKIVPDYLDRICEDVTLNRPLKIVIDCGNGVAGGIAPKLFSMMGCDVEPLFCEVDGNFPHHHPDPSEPENLDALISLVKLQQADIGIAFDGDGDRLGVVDCEGNIIWPDRQMMLFAKDVLSRNPGSDIIFDVKCTNHLARVISENAGVPLMWKTGHSLIKGKLQETGSPLAGEMSGHIFFGERWYGFDDALYAAARLLEIISADDRSTVEIFAELPNSVNTPELKIMLEEGEPAEFMKKFIAKARFDDAKISTIDGLRADFIDGWGLVRSSNTTPCLVLRFDADTEGALEQIKQRFKDQIMAIRSDLELPF